MKLKKHTDTDPVIRKVLVDNLPHLGLVAGEYVRLEEEDDIQHAGLGGDGRASVLWEGISRDLVVQVVRTQPAYHHANKLHVDWNATVNKSYKYG